MSNLPADTKPKAPAGLHERLAAEEPPRTLLADTAEMRPIAVARPPARPLLLAIVLLGPVCVCLLLVGLAGVAGYRDGLATNDVKITQTLATGIAEQYGTGVAEMNAGSYEMAAIRFQWIVETLQPAPEYMLNSREMFALASTMGAVTPLAPATVTPDSTETLSPTETAAPTTAAGTSPTPSGPDPEDMYQRAQNAMAISDYEEAIEWLEALQAFAPDYRPQETQAMLMDALTLLGGMYLRGSNPDGEDQLARGVLLIYRADEIGTVEPSSWLYEADFAERYLNARNYVNGGNYAAALPILQTLCDENCEWAYRGVSVRNLLERAQSG